MSKTKGCPSGQLAVDGSDPSRTVLLGAGARREEPAARFRSLSSSIPLLVRFQRRCRPAAPGVRGPGAVPVTVPGAAPVPVPGAAPVTVPRAVPAPGAARSRFPELPRSRPPEQAPCAAGPAVPLRAPPVLGLSRSVRGAQAQALADEGGDQALRPLLVLPQHLVGRPDLVPLQPVQERHAHHGGCRRPERGHRAARPGPAPPARPSQTSRPSQPSWTSRPSRPSRPSWTSRPSRPDLRLRLRALPQHCCGGRRGMRGASCWFVQHALRSSNAHLGFIELSDLL